MMNSLVLSCFPLLYFYNLLYYTDVGSVLFVLSSYSCSIRNHHFKSAMVRKCDKVANLAFYMTLRSARSPRLNETVAIQTFSKHKILRARTDRFVELNVVFSAGSGFSDVSTDEHYLGGIHCRNCRY